MEALGYNPYNHAYRHRNAFWYFRVKNWQRISEQPESDRDMNQRDSQSRWDFCKGGLSKWKTRQGFSFRENHGNWIGWKKMKECLIQIWGQLHFLRSGITFLRSKSKYTFFSCNWKKSTVPKMGTVQNTLIPSLASPKVPGDKLSPGSAQLSLEKLTSY